MVSTDDGAAGSASSYPLASQKFLCDCTYYSLLWQLIHACLAHLCQNACAFNAASVWRCLKQETLDLKRGSRDVCVECVSFAEAEVNDLCLGSEDGCLMTANIHGK